MRKPCGKGFVNWRGERTQDAMERLRVLLGGTRGTNTRRGPGIRDHLRDFRSEMQRCTGLTACAAVMLCMFLLITATKPASATRRYSDMAQRLAARLTVPARVDAAVRKVNETADYEEYSNGLVVMNTWRAPSRARIRYPVFLASGTDAVPAEWRTEPAGIVYHSTESSPLPMDEEWHPDLPRIETYLLEFLRYKHAYHFLIDRTGRVFRIVPETDIAYHAGKSVWGDDKYVYVNLNASYLGVAFEREAGDTRERVTPDQIQSGRLLTDMLRAKYGIPPSSCVTHAQVSVNPSTMLIGAHTDWASGFPFEALGLEDNYGEPPVAMLVFGFDYDQWLIRAAGDRTWSGLLTAHEEVQRRASALGVSVPEYKAELQRRYREIRATLDT